MLLSLQASNFRMLAANAVSLGPTQILIGQNGTGKTTFLHALRLLSQLQQEGGVLRAIEDLAPSFFDLCFDPDLPIALAAEMALPQADGSKQELRYEVELGISARSRGKTQVLRENLFLLPERAPSSSGEGEGRLRPSEHGTLSRATVHDHPQRGWLRLIHKSADGEDRYRDEVTGEITPFRLGQNRTSLSGVIEDSSKFSMAMGALRFLRSGVRFVAPALHSLQRPAPPGQGPEIASDGGNLPQAARDLKERDPVLFDQWVRHVGLAIAGVSDIDVYERPEDKHQVLRARFLGKHEAKVPSWLLSEGTLRVMALSLLTFAAPVDEARLFLVEDVDTGLHPLAMQSVYEALSSPPLYTQVFCTTHSPVLLGHAALQDVLLFRRSEDGSALIRRGDEDDVLRDWLRQASIVDLFARGILG